MEKSIRFLLILGFSLICAITVAMTIDGYRSIGSLCADSGEIVGDSARLIIKVKDLETQTLVLRRHEKDMLLNTADREQFAAYRQRFTQAAEAMEKTLDEVERMAASGHTVDAGERERLARIRPRFESYRDRFLALADRLQRQGESDPARANEAMATIKDDIHGVGRSLEEARMGEAVLGRAMAELQDNGQTVRSRQLAFGLGGLVASVLVMLYFTRRIEGPIDKIVAFTNKVADGDLGASEDSPMPSELKAIHDAQVRMVNELKLRIGAAEGILDGLPVPYLMVDTKECVVRTNKACMAMLELDGGVETTYGRTLGDVFYNDPTRNTAVGKSIKTGEKFLNLDVQIAGHKGGSVDVLANVFPLYGLDGDCIGGFCVYIDMTEAKSRQREIAEQNERITETSRQAMDISAQTASASEQLSAQVEQTAEGTDQQRRRVQEAATALEQMSASILEIAGNASSSAQSAEDARDKARNGREIMDATLASVARLRTQSDELKESLNSLGRQAKDIGSVMAVISDIADQTNLLALNAAIEAARAGDAGRGFAVVADEVRKLAEKTTTATKEVGDAVRLIQTETTRNLDNMDSTMVSIDESAGYVDQAGSVLLEIVDIVGDSAQQIAGIATASEEQSAAVEEISRSMDDVNVISADTAEAMTQAAQAVMDLSALAQKLDAVLARLDG